MGNVNTARYVTHAFGVCNCNSVSHVDPPVAKADCYTAIDAVHIYAALVNVHNASYYRCAACFSFFTLKGKGTGKWIYIALCL